MIRLLRRIAAWLRFTLANLFSRRPVTGPGEAVVSLTSYSLRVKTVHFAIESIARGAVLPGRLILWLDEVAIVEDLPGPLRRLQRRGLDIRLTENFGPHKKYFPYLLSGSPLTVPLVTADDDVIYPRHWLAELLTSYRSFPQLVSCHRAHQIRTDADGLRPYDEWDLCADDLPSHTHFATGVSGVLYPPEAQRTLLERGNSFREAAPSADDVWINAILAEAGVRVRQTRPAVQEFLGIRSAQDIALWRSNVKGGKNDEYLANCYSREAVRHVLEDSRETATEW